MRAVGSESLSFRSTREALVKAPQVVSYYYTPCINVYVRDHECVAQMKIIYSMCV